MKNKYESTERNKLWGFDNPEGRDRMDYTGPSPEMVEAAERAFLLLKGRRPNSRRELLDVMLDPHNDGDGDTYPDPTLEERHKLGWARRVDELACA